jgi:Protein of unknown function (DUF3352)
MKLARAVVLALLCLVAAVFAAGCGSSSGGGGDDDPAAIVPATAPLYAEATVRPEGKLRDDAEAALSKILKTDDPGAKITSALQDASKQQGDLSFKDDIEPWLGDRIGVAVTALHGNNDADYALVIASTDDGKADDALSKHKGAVKRSYKGVDYRFDPKDKTAAAVVDHRVVIGTENGLKATIDASKGDSLAEGNSLRGVRAKVAQDRIGLFYLDFQGLFRTISQSAGSDPQVGALLQAAAGAAPKTIGAALQAQADQLRIDAVSIGTPKSATTGGSGADALAGLPASAWLGLGVANLGQTLDRVVEAIAGAGGLTGVAVNSGLRQFQQQTGLDLRKDVLSWMSDAGVFVEGTTKSGLGGALVIKSTDPAKSKRTLSVLERLARRSGGVHLSHLRFQGVDAGFTIRGTGSPRVDVGLAGDKVVISVGNFRAFKEAIDPGQPLGSAPAFTDAAAKLGNGLRPSFYLDFQKVVELIGAFAGSDADFQKAKPYLDTFGAVVGGGKDESDGVTRSRIVVTLR